MNIKIGYPCISLTLECSANKTFRLKSYTPERLVRTVKNNLECLFEILKFNKNNGIKFFRITSDMVPFASHPICRFNWQTYFEKEFKTLGTYIIKNNVRISMHPDQFIFLNSRDTGILRHSLKELEYHADLMELMGLNRTAKIQLHVGGIYNDKEKSIQRFIWRYKKLSGRIKSRLVIENDEKNYSLLDCLRISRNTGIPVLFDVFHHRLNNNNETIEEAVARSSETWTQFDGKPMIDYSSQDPEGFKGQHAKHIDLNDFTSFIRLIKNKNVDIMLEIKDKEQSAIKALKALDEIK